MDGSNAGRPLHGVTVVELASIGPGPFCGMMLADLGARVVRVERASASPATPPSTDPLLRGRHSIALDLRNPQASEVLLRLIEPADALIEGFRPGTAERLGIGPGQCLARNPRLVYGRVTGWGQQGPLAHAAGHDINFIALSGALHLIGPQGGKPSPPLNLVGDFGGGGMLLTVGVLAALFEARRSGRGQVVDAAMVDGAAAQLAMFFGFRSQPHFRDATGENFLAGAAPFYDTYRTADDKYVAIGALEPAFQRLLLGKLGLDPAGFAQLDVTTVNDPAARARWPALREAIAARIATRTRDEWCEVLEGTDACFAPVLTLTEAPAHPHHMARGTFIEVEGVVQHAPAPRFEGERPSLPAAPRRAGEDTDAILEAAGFSAEEIVGLRQAGVLA